MADIKGIKNYDRIRRYIEHIYLYGFYTREDFAKAGIGSVQDYDYGTSLIRALYPDMNDTALWKDGRKQLRFVRHYERNGESRLADSYLLRSMDEKVDLPRLLVIFLVLKDIRSARTHLFTDFGEFFLNQNGEEIIPIPSDSTFRRIVDELCEYGFVTEEKKTFGLAPKRLDRLSPYELRQLYDFVLFAGGTTYPRVAGNILRRSIEREFMRRQMYVKKTSPILLRHNEKRCVLDEENVYILLSAIKGYTKKEKDTKNVVRYRPKVEMYLRGEKITVVPVALKADTRLGRWYLLAYDGNEPIMRRLSDMRDIQETGEVVAETQWEDLSQQVLSAFADTGCSGLLPENGAVLVEAELNFEQMPGMFWQFKREMRIGEIEEREGKMFYRAHINDPWELIPWLRSFAPWLKVLPGDHDLDTRLNEDLKAMREKLRDVDGDS